MTNDKLNRFQPVEVILSGKFMNYTDDGEGIRLTVNGCRPAFWAVVPAKYVFRGNPFVALREAAREVADETALYNPDTDCWLIPDWQIKDLQNALIEFGN